MARIDKKSLIRRIVDVSFNNKAGHIASSLSILDILYCLYDKHITQEGDDRNRLILSKGHAALGLYTILENFHLLEHDLDDFCKFDSMLGGHPSDKLEPVECSTGSLGHGLPIAIGMAMAYKIKTFNNRIYVIIGDGEMNEGTIWESLLLASSRNLNNLTCILDFNRSNDRSIKLDNLKNKITSFNWNCVEIDGHDYNEINDAIVNVHNDMPTFIIANTIKGHGISFMENNPEWHHKHPTELEYNNIIDELQKRPLLKTSLLINTREYGFFSSMFQILDNIKYCEDNDIKPIICLGEKFIYKSNDIENGWNSFFENINDGIIEGNAIDYSSIPNGELYIMNNFLLCEPSTMNLKLKIWEEHVRDPNDRSHRIYINEFILKYLNPVSYIHDEIDNFTSSNFTKNVLGVHIRGTDYGFHNIDAYINQIRLMVDTYQYDKIYIASDNKESINIINSKFENVCWYHTELRTENISDSAPVCHIVHDNDKVKHGHDVLIESFLLSKCNRLICINSNVAGMAGYLNPTMPIDLLCRQPSGG